MIEKLMLRLGYAKLPKAGEGQYLRSPAVCKMPVRKVKGVKVGNTTYTPVTAPTTEDMAFVDQRKPDMVSIDRQFGVGTSALEARANLCDVCKASAQDCRKAVKETDTESNTVKCTEYK